MLRANVSHSALSRTIRALEEDVGARLFDRDNRSVSMTPQGESFEVYARDALSRWNEIRQQLQSSDGDLHGSISVYCSVTASHSMLFDLLQRLRPTHPGIEIKVHTGNPDFAITRVQTGDEDFAIAACPPTVPRGLSFRALQTSPLVFIAPCEQAVQGIPGNGPPKAAADWQSIPMILSEGGLARSQVDNWFRGLKVTPHIYAQVTGNEAIVSMVSLGLGVGVVPKIVLDNSGFANRVEVWKIQPELEPYHLGLFTQTRRLRNPIVAAFWELME